MKVESKLEKCNPEDIGKTFSRILTNRRANRTEQDNADKEHFIPYRPADLHTEQGFVFLNTFALTSLEVEKKNKAEKS